jgi:hypothetical protein
MSFFSKGFVSYFESGQFYDTTLVVAGNEYKVHRIILVYSSGYFAKKLLESPPDNHKLELDLSDPDNLFPVVLRYIYEGTIVINDVTSVPLLSLANYLKIDDLKKRVASHLTSRITRKNALFVLQKALEFNTEEVISKCILVIARNYSHLAASESEESPFKFMPVSMMLTLLNHGSLAVASEYSVYQTGILWRCLRMYGYPI